METIQQQFQTIANPIVREDMGSVFFGEIADLTATEITRVATGKRTLKESLIYMASQACMDGQNIIKVNNE